MAGCLLNNHTTMDVRYTLSLEDHLAWYDHHLATPDGRCLRSSVPCLSGFLDRFRRWRYSRWLVLPRNRLAFGGRTLEATEQGSREFSAEINIMTPWSEIALVAVTSSHLFLAHKSMNAHIVPLRFFESDAARESFVFFARSHVNTHTQPAP